MNKIRYSWNIYCFICKILFVVINFVKILRDIKFFQLNKEC